jgi:hypothetical protein
MNELKSADDPAILLAGQVNEQMYVTFRKQLESAPTEMSLSS